MSSAAHVTFVPAGRSVEVEPGTRLLDAAGRAGVVLVAPCGGRGACGRCAVTVIEGALAEPDERERKALARARVKDPRIRLSCFAQVVGDVTVRPIAGSAVQPQRQARVASAVRVAAGVDLGTTTVAAWLIDTERRIVVAKSRVPNMQARFGGDVLSRVSAAQSGELAPLTSDARASLHDALDQAAAQAGVLPDAIERIAIAGNTAMISLLVGADVAGLSAHPFQHTLSGQEPSAEELLGAVYAHAEVVLVPPVAAFVGGDLIAGLVAEGLISDTEDVLYADLGTNAEVAAMSRGRTVVASAPAGPAFEGWGIACGGQAGPGGIVALKLRGDGEIELEFDGDRATHLTGSGLISAVALLRRIGQIDDGGLMHVEGPLCERVFHVGDVRAVSLCADPHDRSVYISQLDVRALQAAKAAVAVALRMAAREAGVGRPELRSAIVAGAFGGGVDTADLVDLGIVPQSARSLTRMAPDAAVRGAADIALDPALVEDARVLAGAAQHLDLAARPEFSREFIDATRLAPYDL